MSSPSATPWSSWPRDLPTCGSTPHVHTLSEQYSRLNDKVFLRSVHSEIRDMAMMKAIKELKIESNANGGSALILFGGKSEDFELYDSDVEKCEFRQEAYFRYIFGINEPDCIGIIDLNKQESILLVPYVKDDAQRWNGDRREPSYYCETYGVTHCQYNTQVNEVLKERNIKFLYSLYGQNLDSDNMTRTPCKFEGMEQYTINDKYLYGLLTEMRVFKTEKELELMRLGNFISSQAHVYVMRHIKPGMMELQLEALYKAWCHFHGGARHQAYTCICGSGTNGSILHYGHAARPNDRILKDGDSVVLDMGAEFAGYATDITRSFAVNGHFTPDQKAIHDAVVDAQETVIRALKPGVYWPDMHRLAERVIIKHLIAIGILHNGTEDDMEKAFIGSVFMPHGLGHFLGLNVHDVGGYETGTGKAAAPGVNWLRCGRTLQAGMVITVEPGIYFNDPWINQALKDSTKSQYINEAVLQRFRGTGGCRLEDDVIITQNGCENLTILPTTVQQIEQVMQNN